MSDSESVVTIRNYLDRLNTDLERLIEWRDAYKETDPEYNLFEIKLQKFTASKEYTKDLLGKCTADENIVTALIGIVVKEETVSRAYARCRELKKNLLENSDYLVADTGYLARCLKKRQDLVFIVGLSHWQALREDLVRLGWDENFGFNGLKQNQDESYYIEFGVKDFHQVIDRFAQTS